MERLDSSGVGRSKGFGFAEFVDHQDALDVLRATNNNPAVFGPDRRPIVDFAIENSLILQRLEQRKTKSLQKFKPRETSGETNAAESKRKRERNGNRGRKRLRKDENVDQSAKMGEKVHSNVRSGDKLNQTLNVSKVKEGLKNREGKNKGKNKASESQDFASRNLNTTAVVSSEGPRSRAQQKRKDKVDKEEEKFNQIVEKYKKKLFGENSKQLKASRWFDA